MVKSGARFTLVDLSSDIPPCRRHLVDKSGTMSSKLTFGQLLLQADLQSDIYPSRGI